MPHYNNPMDIGVYWWTGMFFPSETEVDVFLCIHPWMKSPAQFFLFGLIQNKVGFVTISYMFNPFNRLPQREEGSCALGRNLGAEGPVLGAVSSPSKVQGPDTPISRWDNPASWVCLRTELI